MKYKERLSYFTIIGMLLFALSLERCNPDDVIIIPPIDGDFDVIIDPKPKLVIEYRDTIIYKDKEIYIDRPIEVIKWEKYAEADDVEQAVLYKDCIAINEYEEMLDDEHLTINVNATTVGTLKSLGVSYHIKERSIQVPSNKRIGLLLGAEYGNRTSLDNSIFKGNFGLQTKGGNIFTVSADTDKNLWIGGMIKI